MKRTLTDPKKWLPIIISVFLLTLCMSSIAESTPMLSLNESSIVLVKGRTAKLIPSVSNVENAKKLRYIWESSDPAVATVTNGTIKAIDGGNAVITCSTVLEDGITIKSTVEVVITVPVTSLKLVSKKQLTIKAGSTENIRVEISPQNATNKSLKWESSDNAVATVDKNGVITAKSAGKATISAVTEDGSKKKVQVSVYVPSLYSAVNSVNVNSFEGKSIDVFYYGSNWNNDIKIVQKGNAFNYSISGRADKYTISFAPMSAGTGSLTISDKKDPKSKLQFDVTVTSGAIQVNQYVLLTKCSCNKGQLSFSFKNNSGNDIAMISFYVIPYNRFNEIIYYKGYEARNGEPRFYNYENTLNAGKSSSLRGWMGLDNVDTSVDHIDIAVYDLRFTNGQIVNIADSDMIFFSSLSNSYKKSVRKRSAVNTYPDKATLSKSDSFKVGYTSTLVFPWDAKHYGYKHGGFYISEIVSDSMADKAGLKTRDLIISINGINVTDDSHGIEKAKAKMVDEGKSIVLEVERYAQEGTLTLVLKK